MWLETMYEYVNTVRISFYELNNILGIKKILCNNVGMMHINYLTATKNREFYIAQLVWARANANKTLIVELDN